jgi:hypothetical protein
MITGGFRLSVPKGALATPGKQRSGHVDGERHHEQPDIRWHEAETKPRPMIVTKHP